MLPLAQPAHDSFMEQSLLKDYELQDLSGRSESMQGSGHNSEDGNEAVLDDKSDLGGPLLSHKHRRRNVSAVCSLVSYTSKEEHVVIRKLDRNVTLFVALLYLLSFLDRSNIGNARIAGLSEDLKLSSSQFEWLLTAFYITYISFEWMTLLYRIIPPHIYITLCVAAWGLVASLQSLATSFWSLVLLRALLGVAEAAFGPGVPFYLSLFFKQDELALRVGLFISAAPLSTSFASSLAWLITKAAESGPIAPWRCLFLIEGFPSVITAVFAWSKIPDSPSRAAFLTPKERQIAQFRLQENESPELARANNANVSWSEVLESVRDPKVYVMAVMLFCCNVAFSSLPVFLPTIIKEMGYEATYSQALSSPPYIVAFVATLLVAYLSDRTRNRSIFVCSTSMIAASGYAMIALAGWFRLGPMWRYAGIYPATAGFFSAITIIISWTLNMHQSHSKRGIATAILQYIGQCGPLLGTHLYPNDDKPFYVRGMTICSGFMILVSLLSLALHKYLVRANRALDNHAIAQFEIQPVAIGNTARKHAPFRYLT